MTIKFFFKICPEKDISSSDTKEEFVFTLLAGLNVQ
jgi:hypothetical protein